MAIDRQGGPDSELFASAFADHGVDASELVPWEARAIEVGASRLPAAHGMDQLLALWSRDKYMSRLPPDALPGLENHLEFARVPAERDLIRQDEFGSFMIVLLKGAIAVDRRQPWGEVVRLAEAKPGDMLGEMSLLDGGVRFSVCTTLLDCEIAVLRAEALDGMMADQPRLAGALVALLARKLSVRLRVLGARLSERE